MIGFENLWIIGNGFDLSCGLKTSYIDFLTWYTSSKNEAFLKKDEYERDMFIPKTEHYLARMYDEPMQVMRNTFFSLDYYVNHFDAATIEHFKSIIRQEKDDDKKIISWTDLELRMGKLTEEISTPAIYGLCIDDLHLAINKYMREINSEYVDYKGKKVLCDIFENVDLNNTVFIVLNYTRHFEQFIRSIKDTENFAIVYLHGTAEDGNTVFGVGDEMQIFNPEFAKNPNISQRLIKDIIAYDYFNSFLENNLTFVRDVVNIFGCSMGESDASLWYSFLGKYNQSGNGTVNVYDAYKKTYKANKKILNYADPKKAKENEILCNMIIRFTIEYDNREITDGIFNEIVFITEGYITALEQRNNINGSRMSKYCKIKKNGDLGRYLDAIDKYLGNLEMKYGRIDAYADKLDSTLVRLNNFVDKAEKSIVQSNSHQEWEKLDKIVGDAEVVEFRKTLQDFIDTGKLSTPFLGMQPGVHQITEEPLKTILNEYSRAGDGNIKSVIAKKRGDFYNNKIDGAMLAEHQYKYLHLNKFANEKCGCDIDLAIGEIANLDNKGEFMFIGDGNDSYEGNPLIQEDIRFRVNKVKKILHYHPTYGI